MYTAFLLFILHVFSLSADILGADFHWLRLDADGMWSHKLGEKRPTRIDNAGQIIMDPRAALRLANCLTILFLL